MINFADRLNAAIQEKNNPTVLGLDPHLEYLPDDLKVGAAASAEVPQSSALALTLFNQRLIDALYDLIPAVKLQAACYEQYGPGGLDAMRWTIDYARSKGLIVIVDGKRNDIGSTAAAYARAYLGTSSQIDGSRQSAFPADALTVNGYPGHDGVAPFAETCRSEGKGIFILVRTSNPSAGDLQDLRLEDGRRVYEAMADLVSSWGREHIGQCGYSSVGAVVGATWPQQAIRLRQRMPNAWILIPGYGAQGGTADDAVCAFGPDNSGGLVNASRSLMLAWQRQAMDHDLFDLAARREALDMRQALRTALDRRRVSPV
ncbi:MAG: orotidine-5'-phosphate decarboxylase [Ruminococcaceae bacterium]|nr:orotidine-5'-phosphate decarboxylase [Oscillospiraceae bacterium]